MEMLLQGATIWTLILFLVGIGFLIAEMFEPGFGVCGVLGILCLTADILITARTLAQGLMLTGVVLVIVAILLIVFLVLASKGLLPKRLLLKDATDRESGFSGVADLTGLVGKTGRTLTVLRPVGTASIDGKRFDVVSRGEYVPADTEIVVLSVEGNRVCVAVMEQNISYIHKQKP